MQKQASSLHLEVRYDLEPLAAKRCVSFAPSMARPEEAICNASFSSTSACTWLGVRYHFGQGEATRVVPSKFAVIDNKTVITGSFNWSPSAAHTNDETLLIIESPQLAAHFTREIDRLWCGADLGVTARMQRTLQQRRDQCGIGLDRE